MEEEPDWVASHEVGEHSAAELQRAAAFAAAAFQGAATVEAAHQKTIGGRAGTWHLLGVCTIISLSRSRL